MRNVRIPNSEHMPHTESCHATECYDIKIFVAISIHLISAYAINVT